MYRNEPALHELDFDSSGFEWIDCSDADGSLVSLIRKGRSTEDIILAVCNFTPVLHQNYRAGVPRGGYWKELLNSDAREYSGGGQGNLGGVDAVSEPFQGRPFSINMVLPPMGVVFFKSAGEKR